MTGTAAGSGAAPAGECAVVVRNDTGWGVDVRAQAPAGPGPSATWHGPVGYLERGAERTITLPCSLRSVGFGAELDEMSDRSDMWRVMGTGFSRGACLLPGDTAVAVLEDRPGREGQPSRWWEWCGTAAGDTLG